jgi:hypothetical protein
MKLRTSLLVAVALAVAVAVISLAPATTVHASHTNDSDEEKKEKEDVFEELNDGPKTKSKVRRTGSTSVKSSNLDNEEEITVKKPKKKESSGEPRKKKGSKLGRSESNKLKSSKKTGVNENDVKPRRSSKLKKVDSKNSNVDDTDNNSTKRRKSKLDKSKRKSFSVKKLNEIEFVEDDDDTPPNTNVPPPNTNVQDEPWRNWPGSNLSLRAWIYNFFRVYTSTDGGNLENVKCSEDAPKSRDARLVHCKLPISRGSMTQAEFRNLVENQFRMNVELPDNWTLTPRTQLVGGWPQDGILNRTPSSPVEYWVLLLHYRLRSVEREVEVFIPANNEEMPDNN